MGNKLEQLEDAKPDSWLRSILVDKFDEYQVYYRSLSAHAQTMTVKITNGKDIFCMD